MRPSNRPRARVLALAATLGGVGSEVITWANESASMGGGPSGRAAVAAALQADTGPLDGRLWLFGGMLDASTYSDELWYYSVLGGTWQQVAATPGGPAAAHGSCMAAVGRELFVLGGQPALDGRIWVYHTLAGTWSSFATGQSGRSYHTMTRVDSKLWVFGGAQADSDPQLLLLDAYTRTASVPAVAGSAPSARKEHSMVHYSGALYLFGGVLLSDGASLDGTLHQLDACSSCGSRAWRSLSTSGVARPAGRRGHSASVIGHTMYIFGGVDATGAYHNAVHSLDLRNLHWSQPPAIGTPPQARWGHAATLVNERVVVWGGVAGAGALAYSDDAWSLSHRCQGRVELKADYGQLSMMSSGTGATDCTWVLKPAGAHQQVQLHFSYFALQPGHQVGILDGAVALPALVGSALPRSTTSTRGSLELSYSAGAGTGEGYGFRASFSTVCAAGYQWAELMQACQACSAGSFAPAGALACSLCDERSYSDEPGSAACTPCPDYSRAAGPGAADGLQCVCLEGFSRRNDSAPCTPCPTGAVCPGGTMGPWKAADGWCLDGADYLKCCGGGCAGGADACPGDVAALGEEKCPTLSILTMSVLAFAVSAIVLAAVGAFCWCIGFTAGVRRGNRMALRDVMRKFNLSGEEEGDNLDSLDAGA